MERSPAANNYPRSVLKLIDSLRKEHYFSTDRLKSIHYFKSFEWETYKQYAKEKFQIIFTLAEKIPTLTPKTTTQLTFPNKNHQNNKKTPRHIFLTILLIPSQTTHRFLIKKPSTYLCKMLDEEKDNIYVASEVGIKLLKKERSEEFEVIFSSTLKTSYRKIDESIFDRFFAPDKRNIDIYTMGEEERQTIIAENKFKQNQAHLSEYEWDVSEHCEDDGSISLQNIFRQQDYSTTLIGYIFKVKKPPVVRKSFLGLFKSL